MPELDGLSDNYGSTAGAAGSGQGGAGAGQGGSGSTMSCVDGCAIMYIPFATGSAGQFFTINLDITNGVDLSTSVLTARLRTLQGSSETIQFYASALPNFNFNGAAAKAPLSSFANGGTITMDLTSTGAWDHTKVMSFGFSIAGAGIAETVQILVEEVTITNSSAVGPWLFTNQADVNENTNVDPNFYTPNILFANPYNAVPGAKGIWMMPSP